MFEQIVNLILEYVEPENEITPDSNIQQELDLNSFDLVCFSADLEGIFGVVVDAEEMFNCATVGDLIKKIEEKQAKQ